MSFQGFSTEEWGDFNQSSILFSVELTEIKCKYLVIILYLGKVWSDSSFITDIQKPDVVIRNKRNAS